MRVAAAVLVVGALAAPAAGTGVAAGELAAAMRDAGLDEVAALPGARGALRGRLPGDGPLAVLLFAGCAGGGETSRLAALAAAADLARTPRRHSLEVVACGGGPGAAPEAAREAARAWLDLHPAAEARVAVLAALHLELDDRGGPVGVGRLLAAAGSGGRRLPPAWLAHAVLAGGRAGGGRLAIGDRRWPLLGQLLGRLARPRSSSGAEPFLAAGVPALTIAGGGRDAEWGTVIAAIVRRLDALAGRPRDDDVYLALGGRVWSRRDLYWAGLAIWAVLIAAGLPGVWRGAGSGQRRRRGRRYLPGFLFRMLFLVTLLLAPAATLVLLAPAALLTLPPLSRPMAVGVARALAALPAALFAGYWAVALAAGRVGIWPAQPLRLALLVAGVGLAARLIGRRRATALSTGTG